MYCNKCNKKVNVRNIVRMLNSDIVYCDDCCKNDVDNKDCDVNVNVKEDFENKKNEMLAKSFILTYSFLHKYYKI